MKLRGMATPVDILYHYAARNISPRHTLDIARLALTHKSGHSEPVVAIAGNIVKGLQREAYASIIRSPYPQIPPYVDTSRLIQILPMVDEWKVNIPQDILDLALHDLIIDEAPLRDVDIIIKAGANVNTVHTVRYFPPLVLAVRKGNDVLVRMLLEAGANPNIEMDGHTPLRHARWGHHDLIVSLLLEYGACDS